MQEIWKDIKGYEGLYEVSNYGNVKSLNYNRNKNNPKILKSWITKTNPYPAVKINNISINIHRLVAEAFIPNPNNYPVVNHIDCNKLNNRVDNLEWCSYSYNTKEAIKNGLYDKKIKMLTLKPLRSKKIGMYDKNNKLICTFRDSVQATNILKENNIKICSRNIRSVCNGVRKSAGGYIWKYL